MVRIGVLALQGDFREHIWKLKELGADTIEVRNSDDLVKTEGLIIPGGESTTIGKMILRNGLSEDLEKYKKPIWGTCAGAILISKEIKGSDQYRIGLIDACIIRNDYGRQVDSFEKNILFLPEEKIIRGIFIRAPRIESVSDAVSVLARDEDDIVIAEQGNVIISTFHPELDTDNTVHNYFIKKIKEKE